MKKIAVFALIFTAYLSYGQKVTISGQNKTYSGRVLKLYTFIDRITFKPTLLDSCTVDSAGNFSFSVSPSTIMQVFVDLTSRRGFFYIVPGHQYHVDIPDYKPLTEDEFLNPYFQPQYIRLPVINTDTNNLNYKIFLFDKYYNITINQLVIRSLINKDSVEYAISLLKRYAPKDSSEFYKNYCKYRFGSIRFATYYKDAWKFGQEYLLHQKPLLYNPAYMSLFNNVFDNCLGPMKVFFPVHNILINLKTGNFQAMVDSFISLDTATNHQTAQLILLKGLHDLFYDQTYLQENIILTIENATKTITDSNLLLITHNILDKITALRPGYAAPDFNLPGHLGIHKSLKNYRGKFIYLNFCHPKSLACQEQLPLLKRYAQGGPDDFTVVTILYGVDKKQFKEFLKKHKDYNWPILRAGNNHQLLKKYKVVAFPTYYLIDPDGKLLTSPAPAPTENFDEIFLSEYKKWHKEHAKQPGIRTP